MEPRRAGGVISETSPDTDVASCDFATSDRQDPMFDLFCAIHLLGQNGPDTDILSRRRSLLENEGLLGRLVPGGLVVVINVQSLEFVYAASRVEALKAFVAKFDFNTPGWVLERNPIALGTVA